MRRATIEMEGAEATLLREALSPEARRAIPRTKVRVGGRDNKLTIDIEAADVNALRAALNSYLRWITVGMGSAAVVKDGGPRKSK